VIADSVSKSVATDTPRVRLILENERLALLSNGAVDAMIAKGADPEALQKAYDAQYGNVEPKAEYNASHILVETAETAQEVIQMINDGGDFAEVAKEKSTGPSGPNGGELGWFGEGVMVPEFQAAVLEMEAGTVSEPVQTQFGWHVIKLNETREVPAPTLEEVSEELSQTIIQGQIEVAIDEIRSAATIERIEIAVPQAAIRENGLSGFPNVSAIDGVRFSSIAAGVKYQGRDDVMLAEICEGASIAGLFTKSATRSANVLDCQAKLGRVEAPDKGFAIIVNSGNSNAFTGRAGDASVARICDGVSDALGVPTRHVYTASTGVIGERLPDDRITDALSSLTSPALPKAQA